LFGSQFPRLTAGEWDAFARRTFKEVGKGIVPDYDVRLSAILRDIDLAQPLAPLWNAFDALARVPLLVIRGANSDLLSTETAEAMRARRSQFELVLVPDQGHAPLLADPPTIGRIAEFVASCDADRLHGP
jgi:pimeloyl-ACP methyl ester carboxylesterase